MNYTAPKCGEMYITISDIDEHDAGVVFLFTGKKRHDVGMTGTVYSWFVYEAITGDTVSWVDWEWCNSYFKSIT